MLPTQAILDDVLDGLISIETARRDCGVVLSPSGDFDPAAAERE
jgi:hypothetical protein